MINFLPEKNKKEVMTEYSFRVTSLFLIILSLVVLLVLIFLMPAYTLSIYRNGVISEQLAMTKNSTLNQNDDSLNEVKKINEIVKVLSPVTVAQKPVSDFIKSVLSIKGRGITISSITYDLDASQNMKLSFKGFSKTRDDLTTFVKDIKGLNLFSSVDLPISSLVKSSDIDFVISLIIKKE